MVCLHWLATYRKQILLREGVKIKRKNKGGRGVVIEVIIIMIIITNESKLIEFIGL